MYRNNKTGELWNNNNLFEKFPCGYSVWFNFSVIIYGDISVLHNCMNSDAVRFLMWTLQDLCSILRELWYHWCMCFDFHGFSKLLLKGIWNFPQYEVDSLRQNFKNRSSYFLLLQTLIGFGWACMCAWFQCFTLGEREELQYFGCYGYSCCLQNSFILIHHFMMNWDWMEKTNIGIRTHCSLPSAPEAGWTNSFIPGKRDRNPKFAGLIPQSGPEQFPH